MPFLRRIQDICGLRLDGDFSLDQQDSIVDRLERAFLAAGARKVVHNDLREMSRNGYRAVHINANFPAGRIEVQTRMKLQSAWANIFELFGDIYGREIRYNSTFDEPLQTLVSNFQSISDSSYTIDKSINSINRSLVIIDGYFRGVPEGTADWKELKSRFLQNIGERSMALGNQIDVVDSLNAWQDTLRSTRANR